MTPQRRQNRMCEKDKKTSVKSLLLSIKGKAKSLPLSLRNQGILGITRIVARRVVKWMHGY